MAKTQDETTETKASSKMIRLFTSRMAKGAGAILVGAVVGFGIAKAVTSDNAG